MLLSSQPYTVLPSGAVLPDPCSNFIPVSAKYVKLFSHSTLTPLLATSPVTPGVIKVTAWNNTLADLLFCSATEPSIKAPLPASAYSYPL